MRVNSSRGSNTATTGSARLLARRIPRNHADADLTSGDDGDRVRSSRISAGIGSKAPRNASDAGRLAVGLVVPIGDRAA